MTKSNRDNFSEKVRLQLRDRVALFCFKPDCRVLTVGASEEAGKVARIGIAAHITAAAPGGLRYDENLTPQQPQNVSFKNGLAVSYSKLGETYTSLGYLDKALVFYQQYEQLRQQLHNQQPQNVTFKNGLAIAYFKLGVFYYRENDQYQDLVKATSYLKQAHQLWLQLTTLSPNMVEFQRNLSDVERDLKALESISN